MVVSVGYLTHRLYREYTDKYEKLLMISVRYGEELKTGLKRCRGISRLSRGVYRANT